ncbi:MULTISPECIES: hypothetical protein [Chryseobacterium]|jgi:hypothetical protein|uniref:Uncharacterized protein n=2 Tax=Chryseobacterium TaxID=59732 RepID=A0A124F2C5_9FLAO|nr:MULTISPECIES: hypothetical protein [Chryseobacterium]KUJ54316.1 hypothetical protein AR686_17390 [Chryseobacterium aquaticum subsp. greenlandense]QQV01789.1 hypothetical protein I6I61_11910 [Chryseobacterium sp. FDAARGOS 1104]VFB04999.1 Uncharacterised protein [Chryseobacterium taihuense]
MHKTTEYTSQIIDLITRAKIINPNLGSYVEHYLNDDFKYSVVLSNNYGVKISRTLVKDFSVMPSVLEKSDIIDIA